MRTSPASLPYDCSNCGTTHVRGRCLAYGKQCHACHSRNNFSNMCRKTKYKEKMSKRKIHTGEQNCFSDTSNSDSDNNEYFVKQNQCRFKLDTGAQVSCTPSSVFNRLSYPKLNKTNVKLKSYGGLFSSLVHHHSQF